MSEAMDSYDKFLTGYESAQQHTRLVYTHKPGTTPT